MTEILPYPSEVIRTVTILRHAFQGVYWQEGMNCGAVLAALAAEFVTVAKGANMDPANAFSDIAEALNLGRLDPSHDPAGGRYVHDQHTFAIH